MKPQEARVLIIDDSVSKVDVIERSIKSLGSEVVDTVSTLEEAVDVVQGTGFTRRGGPNVVLIDGNLSDIDNRGADGFRVFDVGYSAGHLHKTNSSEGIGAVAVGCSLDNRSVVVKATGYNFYPPKIEDIETTWTNLLNPHLAEPVFMPTGTMKREQYFDFLTIREVLTDILGDGGGQAPKILNVKVSETVEQYGEQDASSTPGYSRDIPVDPNSPQSLIDALNWQADVTDEITGSHRMNLLAQRAGGLVIFDFLFTIEPTSMSRVFDPYGRVDFISNDALSVVPDSYWQSFGLNKPGF